VYIFILFPNKIFLSRFWLEICTDVVKDQNTPFWEVWWGFGYRLADKWFEYQNSPEIRGFFPLGTPKKGSVDFFDRHCKHKAFTNNFYVENLFPMCLV